jgi:hypothetical protein
MCMLSMDEIIMLYALEIFQLSLTITSACFYTALLLSLLTSSQMGIFSVRAGGNSCRWDGRYSDILTSQSCKA